MASYCEQATPLPVGHRRHDSAITSVPTPGRTPCHRVKCYSLFFQVGKHSQVVANILLMKRHIITSNYVTITELHMSLNRLIKEQNRATHWS